MPSWLHSAFGMELPLLEKILRPIIVYAALVLLLRIFGKRELAQLNSFDLVVLLSLSNTVQNAIIGNDNSISGGLIGAAALLGVNYVVGWVLYRRPALDRLIEGSPTTLIENGRIDRKGMERELVTHDELMTVLYRQGFEHPNEVEKCILEPGGTFHIRRKGKAPDDRQRSEILERLAELKAQVDALSRRIA